MSRLFRLVTLVAVGCAKGGAIESSAEEQDSVGVARVGPYTLDRSLLVDVARATDRELQDVFELLQEDAWLAYAAQRKQLHEVCKERRTIAAVRAGLVLDRIKNQSMSQGGPTDAEVEELSRVHWKEVDLPEQVRVAHAVVLKPKRPDLAAVAREVTDALATAAADSSDVEDFKMRAQAIDARGLHIRVEEPPPFVQDGRISHPSETGEIDALFAQAAFQLGPQKVLSPVVETSFGWHVLYWIDRIPPQRMDIEERRALFANEIYTRRSRKVFEGLLAQLQRRISVQIAPNAEKLLREFVALE